MGEVPAREVLWNITGHWLIYPCFVAALAVAVVFFVRRWRLWKIGEPRIAPIGAASVCVARCATPFCR